MDFSWTPLILTFKLAFITTIILLIISIPLAYLLTKWESKFKYIIQTLISMPIVLPPTVLGFYLLLTFNPGNFFGQFIQQIFNVRLVFTFEGLIIASTIYSLPFMVNSLQAGFQSLNPNLWEASYTLGKSKFETLFKVLLPNIKSSLITGIVISFAHTVGEFGVVLMIGGSIPGETKVASIAIYDQVEALNYHAANIYSLILFIIAFTILLTVYVLNKKYLKAF